MRGSLGIRALIGMSAVQSLRAPFAAVRGARALSLTSSASSANGPRSGAPSPKSASGADERWSADNCVSDHDPTDLGGDLRGAADVPRGIYGSAEARIARLKKGRYYQILGAEYVEEHLSHLGT